MAKLAAFFRDILSIGILTAVKFFMNSVQNSWSSWLFICILFQKHNIKIHLFYRKKKNLALKTISPNFITVVQTTKLVVENRQKVRFFKHLEDL